MEEYLLLEEAARRYRISPETLERLVESGRIKAVRIGGRIAVAEKEAMLVAIQATLDDGDELVSISEASRRLGINHSFISNWTRYGWLPVLGTGPRGAKFVSLKRAEALAKLRQREGLRGRRLIPRHQEHLILSSLDKA
jgi:excisionase family DNA binding protein